ncbi:S8 family serine peptidase [Streptomyces mirabilis]|uniref:S8 family serine peptidase n=1 Tax=Streptomyces mirabilis TaxID=68239 RepID=UPI0036ACEEBB
MPATAAIPADPAGPVPPAGAVQQPSGSGGTHTVTLITGDQVTIGTAADGTAVRSFKSPDGTTAGYHTSIIGGSTYVYPDAVQPYVSAGKLDKQLFNVTQLIADGYDDAHADRLPLIVRYTDAAARSRVEPKMAGSTVVHPLDSIQGAALAESREQASAFWSALTGGSSTAAGPAFTGGIAKVWLDGKVAADLADSTAQIGAQKVWAEGNTGNGVKVAVLDSGVDTEHPDLAGQIGDTASFVPDDPGMTDYVGHGTHVASTIAGTGAASDGKERGVAPGVQLEVGKVLSRRGGQVSWVIAGMEWAARDEHAKIINMSLGYNGDNTDPMSQAVNELSDETGALFVAAAGNGGPGSLDSPGAADSALAVGAVDSADQLASFSSQGPRSGDFGLKPEITAPGVDILAARSKDSSTGSGYYTTLSGTSMATPHVAGAAALLAAAHPDWTGKQLKEALVSSAKATPAYTPYQAGGGRVDALAAVHASVFATASAFSGFHPWPQKPGETDVRKVTYTNVGDAPVSLDLAVDTDAAANAFSLSDNRVTVPAHGTTSVTLTATVDLLPADQPVSGMITGTDSAGAVRTRTLIGADREGQRQTLTVVAKDGWGQPISDESVTLVGESGVQQIQLDASGTGTAPRLPAGTYSGWFTATGPGANGPHSRGLVLLSFAGVQLDQDRTVTLDGRQARQITANVPKQGTAVLSRLDVRQVFSHFTHISTYMATSMHEDPQHKNPDAYDSIWALPTGKAVDGFAFGARFRLEQPALTVSRGSASYDDLLVKRAARPLPAGTRKLSAVFADDTSAEALAQKDVSGQVVVVRRSDTATIKEQAEAAAAAGARVLLVVNDGNGRLEPWNEPVDSTESPAPLTVATLNADQGQDLIDALQRGKVELTVTSHPTTDYLYDVVHHWSGAVPADPTWREEPGTLARVDVSFRNYRQGKAYELRYDLAANWAGAWKPVPAPAQGERTDWLTGGVDWEDLAGIIHETSQQSLDVFHYPAGTTHKESWFGPIERPRMAAFIQPTRYDDNSMFVRAPGWGDSGAGHIGDTHANFDVRDWMGLYQGDHQLAKGGDEWLSAQGLAPERLPYRLVVDNDHGTWANPYSTHTLTEWNFTSAASDTTLPLIQLDYGVDTDETGRAVRNAPLTVTASQLPGTTAAIGKPSLEVSYDDGATWQPSQLNQQGADWQTTLQAPASADFASLRVTARDSDGNSVSQTLTRAFGLR